MSLSENNYELFSQNFIIKYLNIKYLKELYNEHPYKITIISGSIN